MDPKKVESLRKLLKEKYKASPEDINDLLGHFVTMRGKWGELFTSMGRRLNVDGLKQFEEMLPKYINDVLDRGYDVFKNNRGQLTVAKKYYKHIKSKKKITSNNADVDFEDKCFKKFNNL